MLLKAPVGTVNPLIDVPLKQCCKRRKGLLICNSRPLGFDIQTSNCSIISLYISLESECWLHRVTAQLWRISIWVTFKLHFHNVIFPPLEKCPGKMEVVKPDFFNASILGFKKLSIVLTGRSIYFRILCKEWFHIQVDSKAQSTKKEPTCADKHCTKP